MIPLPRHTSADGLPSLVRSTATPRSYPCPSFSLRRDTIQILIESYNPSKSLLISSLRMSPSSRLDAGFEVFDEVASSSWLGRSGLGKFASSLVASSGKVMTMKTAGGGDGGERSRGRGSGRGAGDRGKRLRERGRGRDREGGGEGGALATVTSDDATGSTGNTAKKENEKREGRGRGGGEHRGERGGR